MKKDSLFSLDDKAQATLEEKIKSYNLLFKDGKRQKRCGKYLEWAYLRTLREILTFTLETFGTF